MKPNVGKNESYIRIGLGLLSGFLALKTKSRALSSVLALGAASGIGTGLARYCPMSALLGIDNAPELNESPIKSLFKGKTEQVLFH